MTWDLPVAVDIAGKSVKIRNKCDYRVVLDAISALNDCELTDDEKIKCALFIFYDDWTEIEDFEVAAQEMMRIIRGGEDEEEGANNRPRVMDWEHDFPQIAPPVSRVLGYDVRTPDKYTHWFTFLGGYMEIGDCTFATVVGIRSKRAKGKKLEANEIEFFREHRKMVELPQKMTAAEKAELDAEW